MVDLGENYVRILHSIFTPPTCVENEMRIHILYLRKNSQGHACFEKKIEKAFMVRIMLGMVG